MFNLLNCGWFSPLEFLKLSPKLIHAVNFLFLIYLCFCTDALTSTANVDVQIALDDRAVLQVLCGIHRVNDEGWADLVTQAIAGTAQHTACSSRSRREGRNEGKETWKNVRSCQRMNKISCELFYLTLKSSVHSPSSQAFQRIQANKFTAWYKVTSHTESIIFYGPSSELCFVREQLTVLT